MSWLPVLREADVFYGLSLEQLEQVAGICTELYLPRDTFLFRENSPGDEMYLIGSGAVQIQVDSAMLGVETNAPPTTLATLRRGQAFGEIAVIDRGLRSASARASEEDTMLLVIRRHDLVALCEKDCQLGYLIMRNIALDLAAKVRGADLMVREQSLRRRQEAQGTG